MGSKSGGGGGVIFRNQAQRLEEGRRRLARARQRGRWRQGMGDGDELASNQAEVTSTGSDLSCRLMASSSGSSLLDFLPASHQGNAATPSTAFGPVSRADAARRRESPEMADSSPFLYRSSAS